MCSCFGECKSVGNYIETDIFFVSVNKKNDSSKNSRINLKFWVIENLPHAVVIGNKDIESNEELYNIFHNNKLPH